MKKNIFISNTCLSIIIGIIDSTRVILSSKVSKAALDTILFIISTISLYLIVFTIISLIAYLVHKLSPSSIKSIFSRRRIQFFLDTVAIIGLLAFYMTSEPVRIEGSDKTRVANSTIKDYPNILLITVDTLRYDHLSSTGYPEIETPNIDQLSKNGITFTDDNCQIPVTTPSHSSIFTGFNPYIHGSRFNGTPINKKIKTITEYLKDIGYETAAFVSSSTLKSRLSGLNKGFEVYDQFLCPSCFDQRIYLLALGRTALWFKLYDAVERNAERINESVMNWLGKKHSNKFFLWVHYFDPHAPYIKHDQFDSAYHTGKNYNLKADYNLINSIYDRKFIPTEEQRMYIISLYDGEIMFVDRAIGKLIKRLKELNLYDKTLILLTADHGESLGEHEYYFYHGLKLYDPSMRVPLFISGKMNVESKPIIESQVRSIDIAPTLLHLINYPDKIDFEGSSIFPIDEYTKIQRPSYAENINKFSFFQFSVTKKDIEAKKKAITLENKKFIDNPKNEPDEFYDLERDPMELDNIIGSTHNADNFRKVIDNIDKKYENMDNAKKYDFKKNDLEELKTLGYIE